MNDAYANDDYATIDKLYQENSSVVYKWQHYPSYALKTVYQELSEEIAADFNEYVMEDCLYYLFYPDYYAQTSGMSEDERAEYETKKQELLLELQKHGYSQQELKDIYDECKDEYGYVRSYDLEPYLKGENNG